MAKLASKTEWVETENGTRRLVVEGMPIPPGLGLEDSAGGDDVDPRTLTQPVVDEDASQPSAGEGDATGGVSLDNVESSRSRRSGGRQRQASGGGSES